MFDHFDTEITCEEFWGDPRPEGWDDPHPEGDDFFEGDRARWSAPEDVEDGRDAIPDWDGPDPEPQQ